MSSPKTLAAAYAIAKRVYGHTLKREEGARTLHASNGVNLNSAKDLIDAYRHLRRGESFQRTLSQSDMEFYLENIYSNDGAPALQTALHSLWLHIAYYERTHGGKIMRNLRSVVGKYQSIAGAPELLQQVSTEFDKAVEKALSESIARRRKRLQNAPKKPPRVPITILGFARNPDVVAEVTMRAKGKCEGCKEKAPFLRRKDGTPYLEVHHIQQLADDGEDTVENAIALCPNCHRERHYGGSGAII
jgi:5-methylcytosine-specific restriction enzyme A